MAAGASQDRPVSEQPDGRRAGWVTDPFGHRWSISTVATREEPEGRLGDFHITRGDAADGGAG